ncbi:MAG: hypothetical protein LBB20_03355 [Puniceicoccales bacterium]|jgi:hypothetical protein|nr:hypothetical protein [Puniceicoccales bacterium]
MGVDSINFGNNIPQFNTSKTNPNESNIKLVNNSGGFHYLKFKEGLGAESKVKHTNLADRSAKVLNRETAVEENNDVAKSSDVDDISKVAIGSASDRVAIAKGLMTKIAEEDTVLSEGKNSLASHRKPGDQVCIRVLHDLVSVAMGNANNSKPIFKRDDLEKLVSTFCPDKLDMFKNMPATDTGIYKALLGAIKEGMNNYILDQSNLEMKNFKTPSKAQCRSLEKVMSSTLQSMSGTGRTGYKNMTIFGREERLRTVGKVLKYIATAISIASIATSVVLTGGAMLGVIGAVSTGVSMSISISANLAQLSFNCAREQVEFDTRATGEVKMNARMLVCVASFVNIAKDFVKIAQSVVNVSKKIANTSKRVVNFFRKNPTEQEDASVSKPGVIERFINKAYSVLDTRANNLLLASEIDSKMQELTAGFPPGPDTPNFDINFAKTVLETMKGNEQIETINNMIAVFSGVLKKVPEDQLDTCLAQIKSIADSVLRMSMPEGQESDAHIMMKYISNQLGDETLINADSLKNDIQIILNNYVNRPIITQ